MVGRLEQRLREMESISVPQLLVSIGMPDLDSLANAKGNLRNRAQALNAYAANSSLQQQYSAIQNSYNDLGNAAMPQQPAQPPAPSLVPSSRAVWIDGKLLVIKRAETQTGAQIQGVGWIGNACRLGCPSNLPIRCPVLSSNRSRLSAKPVPVHSNWQVFLFG